jgi:Zn-dependent peptidase ImmA (M78 family)
VWRRGAVFGISAPPSFDSEGRIHYGQTRRAACATREWKRFQNEADETDYGWLEYQAYAFAGLVLVPTGHLKGQFQSAVNAAERIGFSREGEPEAFYEYVIETLREAFEASGAVIAKRLR